MVAAINPVFPVIAAQGVAADITLQPGTVIDAQVLKVLANDFVRIAVSNLAIEVISEVPLQAGQSLQLAVSQTANGVRLQILPQSTDGAVPAPEGDAPATIVSTSAGATSTSSSSSSSSTTSASSAALNAPSESVRVTRPLTNLEALAVSVAVQSAAAKQGSLSPLFANASVAASSGILPQTLQQAAQQLLSVRPALDQNLTGEAVKTAFEKSGLFLEQSQKQQAGEAASLPSAGAPDLKAALVVFKQTLTAWLSNSASPDAPSPQTIAPNLSPETSAADESIQPQPGAFAQQAQSRVQADDAASTLAPPLAPQIEAEEVMLPKAALPVADDIGSTGAVLRDVTPAGSPASMAARAAASNIGLTSLQEVLQAFPKGVQDAVKTLLEAQAQPALKASAFQASQTGDAFAHDDVPPPPFRGAAPSAQGIASPSINGDTSPGTVAHHLLNDAEAALARQTLLQIASLPDRVDQPGVRADLNVPRWNFEIPFATPQGTAVAQFEISRDGGNDVEAVSASNRIWRARFSLNIEPAGPVHALVSLNGETTSVRMWAERATTAQQLRANTPQLTQALREAELTPGDIVIAEGNAPVPPTPPRGHFLDRAL